MIKIKIHPQISGGGGGYCSLVIPMAIPFERGCGYYV